jgi:hypothetical protein
MLCCAVLCCVATPPTQILCITMLALALAEDSLTKRQLCDEIIDELSRLPEKMRSFMQVGRKAGSIKRKGSTPRVNCVRFGFVR